MNSGQRIPYISQFLIFLGLVFAGFIFGGLVALIIWQSMVGDPLKMKTEMLNPKNADAVKILQVVVSTIMFLVPTIIFTRIVNKQPLKHLGLKTRFSWIQLGLGILIMFVAIFLSGALSELTNHIPISSGLEKYFKELEKTYADEVMVIANMKTTTDYIISVLIIALAPAIFEELIFRGVLQQLLVKWTRIPWLGILITSVLFSVIHSSYYGFLSRAALGLILGYLFYYSKSIWLPIIAHFFNNAFAVTAMYLMNKQGGLTAAKMDERFPIWYGVLALAVIIALFIAYRNESKKLGTYYLDNTETKTNDPFADQRAAI
jgi:uncharacterized protein